MSEPKQALVSGGAGFIGSHLTERLLAEGHRVTVVDNLVTGARSNLDGVKDHPELTFREADHNLGHRKTITLIAHRLTTVQERVTNFLLEHGQLMDSRTYDELMVGSQRFRAMSASSTGTTERLE